MNNVIMNKKAALLILICCVFIFFLLLPSTSITEIRWLLSPAVYGAEILTGIDFYFIPEEGYINRDRSIVINADCSGYNLLLFNFVILGLLVIFKKGHLKRKAFLFFILPLYTIILNTIRLLLSISIIRTEKLFPFVHEARYLIHEFIGIVILITSIIILYFVSGRPNYEKN